MAPALALFNAEVWPLSEPGAREEALLLEGDRIVAVGAERTIERKARAQGARRLDLGGRRVLPGLIDSHTHLVHQGLLHQRVDLRKTRSKAEALRRVAAAARRHRGPGPLLAEGWDESRWRERAWPAREELDAITQRFPLVVRRIDGHVAVANTLACRVVVARLSGVDLERGWLVEDASLHLNRVWPTPVPQAEAALEAAQTRALRLGITTVHDFVVPSYLRAYQAARRRGRLHLRVHVSPYVEDLATLKTTGIEAGSGDPRLRLAGVKAFADGSIGGHTAALRQPYADDPTTQGRLNWSDAGLAQTVERASRAHLTPCLHAIGDAAIDQVVAAYAKMPAPKRRSLRPRIEHFELHAPEHIEQARDLGVVLSMQPNFVGAWSRPGNLYHQRLGTPRYRRSNEFARIQRAGAPLAFGSDCMPLDPWWGLASVLNAPYPAQRLRLEAALQAYTLGSAYGLGREQDLGTLEPGKRADLIVVEGRWPNPKGVARTRVRATMVGGAWVAGRSPKAR